MAGALRPRTEAARRWVDEHPEETRLIEQAIERERARIEATERPVEVSMRFRCMPSVLEDIKLVVASYPTSDRVFRVRQLEQASSEDLEDAKAEGCDDMGQEMLPWGHDP